MIIVAVPASSIVDLEPIEGATSIRTYALSG